MNERKEFKQSFINSNLINKFIYIYTYIYLSVKHDIDLYKYMGELKSFKVNIETIFFVLIYFLEDL